MASLTAGIQLGNTGVSALIKSAASTATQLADLQDKEQAMQWSSSDQGDPAAYQTYADYLNQRVTKLQATGTVANQSKALSLATTLRDAARTHNSGLILNASIGVQEGNYTDGQKAVLLRNLANQAFASGDQQNGLHLEEQYNNLIIKLQNQAVTDSNQAEANATKAQTANYQQFSATSTAFTQLTDALAEKLATGEISSSAYHIALNQTLQAKSGFLKDSASSPALTPEHQATAQAEYDKLQSTVNQEAHFAKQIAQGVPVDKLVMKDGRAVSSNLTPGTDYVIGSDGTPIYKPDIKTGNLNVQFNQQQGKFTGVPGTATTAGTASSLTVLERTHGGDAQYYEHHLGIDQGAGQLDYFRTEFPGANGPQNQPGYSKLTPLQKAEATQVDVNKTGQHYNAYLLDKNGKPVVDQQGKPIRNQDPASLLAADSSPWVRIGDLASSVANVGGNLKNVLDFVTAHHVANKLPTLTPPAHAAVQVAQALGLGSFVQSVVQHFNQPAPKALTAAQAAPAISAINRATGFNPWARYGVTNSQQANFLSGIQKGQYNWGQAYGAFENQFHTPVSTGSPIDQAFHGLNSMGYFK